MIPKFSGRTCRSLLPFKASTGHFTLLKTGTGSYFTKKYIHGDNTCLRQSSAPRSSLMFTGNFPAWFKLSMYFFKGTSASSLDELSSTRSKHFLFTTDEYSKSSPVAPVIFPISFCCSSRIRSPRNPGPAKRTIKATSPERLATRGAIIPPSLCPISPIFRIFRSFFKKFTAASTSPTKSSVVAVPKFPVDCPTPRSSKRNTPIPCRVR